MEYNFVNLIFKKKIMKKLCIVFALLFLAHFNAYAAPERIILRDKGSSPTRDNLPLYFDIPEVFYNYDEKTQDIIIDGGGAVSYYNVEISSPVTNAVELSTQVDGTYDTFDISSLPAGSHVITIESPSGNIYEGTF